jgi:hypothetical protein
LHKESLLRCIPPLPTLVYRIDLTTTSSPPSIINSEPQRTSKENLRGGYDDLPYTVL